MWNLTQGWRTEGSETTSSDSSFCIDTGSHSNLESPGEIDTSYSLLEEKAEVNSGLRDDAPDSQTDVVKRTTFELVVSRVAYALHMRRFTEYLTRFVVPNFTHVRFLLQRAYITLSASRNLFTNSVCLSTLMPLCR